MARQPEVFVRALEPAEAQRLVKITRTARDRVRLRRAGIVLASFKGRSAAAAAAMFAASAQYAREVIHAFNARFHLHFTPTSSSWLNLVERWFAELTNRKLRRSAHRSVVELEADVRAWINEWNKEPKPFVWTKTADQILETLAAYCQRISDSGH